MTSAGDPEQTSDGLKTASLIDNDNTVTVYVVELGGNVQQVSLVAPTDSVEREEAKEDEANEAQEAEEEKDGSADSVAMATETAEMSKTVVMTGKTSIAVQANDYEIERRSGILPARRRIIPFKFRDFHDPDEMDQDNSSDTDYIPGEVEVAPSRRGRRPGRPPGSRGRGRPRALPKDHCYDRSEEASGAGEASETGSEEKAGVDGERAPEYCDELGGYTCDSSNCGQRFSRLAALKQHKMIQHTGGPARRGRPPKGSIRSTSHTFKCHECSKTFNQKGNMKVHLRVHTGEKPFKCSIPECGKSFCSNESLKRHKLAHMGVKLFPCDICEHKFSSNVALKEHIARHTDTRPYKCDVCDRWFRQVSCLRRHMITHSDETPFSCNVCGRRFSQMVYLKSHMRIHTGEKPFKCKTCNKQFAHHSDLIRHHTVHSGNKPYKCDVCGAAFSDPSSRRRHLREHNGLKPYTCQLCKENFKRSGQLKAHLNKKHMLNKSDIVITKSGQLSGLQFELDSATCGQVQTLVLQENPQYADETATLEHLAARQEETLVVQRSTPGEAPLVDIADENHIIVAQTRLSELAEDGEEQQRQLVVETQRLVQQIQSQLDGASGDGQMVHVAYQIMRDEDNQPILEIQYQPTGVHQDGAGEDIGISQEEQGVGELQMLEGEGKTMVVQSMWGEGEEQMEQPETEQTQDDVGPSQQLMMVQSEEGPSELTNDSSLQSDQMVSVSPALVKQQQMDIVQSVDTSSDSVTMTTSHDHLSNEPENQVSPLLHIDSAVDYVHQPDFASQDYYNWLSNFTEACRVTPLPLDAEHFHKISQVHKNLADVLAMPTGILADKGNFRILMSISRELNEIINEHLTFVLQGLKDNDK